VVKPRHAASGQGLSLLRPGTTTLTEAVHAALEVECKRGETWQLYQVPRGVGVEVLYPSLRASSKEPERPLELKLQTIWGVVVGGTIHTSQEVWITSSGHVVRSNHGKNCAIRRRYGPLPPWILDGSLEKIIQEHWSFLVSESEAIARRWGLDEVRVDWFLGCETLGPRICEVTWMGTGDRLPKQLQLPVAE
ncbi:Snapc3, partial [Symbiodinium pilosum]